MNLGPLSVAQSLSEGGFAGSTVSSVCFGKTMQAALDPGQGAAPQGDVCELLQFVLFVEQNKCTDMYELLLQVHNAWDVTSASAVHVQHPSSQHFCHKSQASALNHAGDPTAYAASRGQCLEDHC